jgi:hypothetical protein
MMTSSVGTFAAIAMGMLGRNIVIIDSPVIEELSRAVPSIISPTAPPNANKAMVRQPNATRPSSTQAPSFRLRPAQRAADPMSTAHPAPISSASGNGGTPSTTDLAPRL